MQWNDTVHEGREIAFALNCVCNNIAIQLVWQWLEYFEEEVQEWYGININNAGSLLQDLMQHFHGMPYMSSQ
jgi:hypothetical protein